MRQVIRLNEQELHNLISESVKRVLNESTDEGWGRNLAMAGALGAGMAFGGMNHANAQNIQNNGVNPQGDKHSVVTNYYAANNLMSNSDTAYYNDYNNISQEIMQNLGKFVQNGRILQNNYMYQDCINSINNNSWQEGKDLYYDGVIGKIKNGCTQLDIANYIQRLGFSNLETPANIKLAIIQYQGNYYIVEINARMNSDFNQFK